MHPKVQGNDAPPRVMICFEHIWCRSPLARGKEGADPQKSISEEDVAFREPTKGSSTEDLEALHADTMRLFTQLPGSHWRGKKYACDLAKATR